MDDTDDPAFVQSFARGLSVIRAFGHGSAALSLTQVAGATGLSRATARRFLLTLEQLGYVRTAERRFALTPRVMELGFSYLSSLTLPEVALPHLEAVAADVGESTSASVLDGDDIVYVARVPTQRIMSVSITIGTRFPAISTSMGRVMLTALPAESLRDRLNRNPPARLTSTTIVDTQALVTELARVGAQGYSIVDGELEHGLRSIAVPVRDHGRVVAAINVATGAPLTRDEIAARFLEPLLVASRSISHDLETLSGESPDRG